MRVLWASCAHPLLLVKSDQERVLDTLLRSLALPMPGEDEGRRRSPAAAANAQRRWQESNSGKVLDRQQMAWVEQ